MPRQSRLILGGHAVHAIQRGNDRRACFQDDRDRLVYLALLRDLAPKSDCALHAYCLMTNHVHLLLTPRSEKSCARLMHGVAQRYATYFNRKYLRTGSLWEGRFKSCLVGSAAYVLACHRYIEMNPVRAGMVGDPRAYLWSSALSNLGERPDPALTPHAEFSAIGLAGYRALFDEVLAEGLVAQIRDAVNSGYPLGSEAFKGSIAAATGRSVSKTPPGPKKDKSSVERSVAVPDLFSGGAAS